MTVHEQSTVWVMLGWFEMLFFLSQTAKFIGSITFMTAFRNSLAALCIVYGVMLAGFLLARLWLGDRPTVLGFFVTGGHLLLLMAVVLLPLSLLTAQPRAATLALLPAALTWGILYGPQFIPNRTASAGQNGQRITVMSYNLLWGRADYTGAARLILDTAPDIVALQEVDARSARQLEDLLTDQYPYHTLNQTARDTVIFSRYPIAESRLLDTSMGSLRSVIWVDDRPLAVYTIHAAVPQFSLWPPVFDSSLRSADIATLLTSIDTAPYPVILLGDFNMPDLSTDYQNITSRLSDVYRQVGWGMGWTHSGPLFRSERLRGLRLLRIDYIFAQTTHLIPLNARVLPDSAGSDHLPVVAELLLTS